MLPSYQLSERTAGAPAVNAPLLDYYRCPEELLDFSLLAPLSKAAGFFRLGQAICYGQCGGGTPQPSAGGQLHDVGEDIFINGTAHLPFDPAQILSNLRGERYIQHNREGTGGQGHEALLRRAYYLLRPALHISIRKHMQKIHLRGWEKAAFPEWPVDRTVEHILEYLLALGMRTNGIEKLPFIWFWPDGKSSAAIMTHDVESRSGRDFCEPLMDLNESFAINSSFQIIPERRYTVPPKLLQNIRARGFEVNVHDLNHDGQLFQNHAEFLRRAARINRYLRDYEALGFRSAVMYRNQDWYDALECSYDMSVPNSAHLDPQRGGCCTVMPYFIGDLVELPVSMTQDYSLFHILGDYSIDLWRKQMKMVMENHGLISFIVHPDYVVEKRARATYVQLLRYLSDMRANANLWVALPRDVSQWWKERSQLRLSKQGQRWVIEGSGKERARIAYAHLEQGQLRFSVESN